jgi:hypothetical protein
MRKASCFLLIASFLLICSVALAGDVDVKTLPGYVDLEHIKIPGDAGKIVEISLGPGLLRIAEKTSDNGDVELTETLSDLQFIQVKSFEIDAADEKEIRKIIRKIEDQLKDEDWERLVKVKDEDEFVIVSIKQDDDERVLGLLVMAVESDGEAVFANIVGKFDLEQLGELDELIELDTWDIIEDD